MSEVCYIDFRVVPMRADRFLDTWEDQAPKVLAYGAKSWSLTRNTEDTLHIRLASVWENRSDFERFWYSDDAVAAREKVIDLYAKPLLPVWHALLGAQ